MSDLPIGELLDDRICTLWLARHLHPEGLTGPPGRHSARRLCRAPGQFPAYRGRGCDGYDTRLTGPVFANTRQRPATLGLVLRGRATGAPTARLARELGRSREQLHPLRQRLPTTRNGAAPTDVMTGTACEADDLDHHAGGETSMPHADPTDPPAPTPTLGPRSAASSRASRASRGSGAAITRIRAPATT